MNYSYLDDEKRKIYSSQIDERWRQLYELEREWADKAIKFLFLTNSGGAVATLSFLGGDNSNLSDLQILNLTISLILFTLGILFVGTAIARGYHYLRRLLEGYQKDASSFYKDLICYKHLEAEDDKRIDSFNFQFLFPYAAFLSFIIGCCFGGYGLIYLG